MDNIVTLEQTVERQKAHLTVCMSVCVCGCVGVCVCVGVWVCVCVGVKLYNTIVHTYVRIIFSTQKATDDARQVSEERIDTKRPPAAIDRQIKQMQTILAQEKDR